MKTIQTGKAPNPIGPYSQGILNENWIFTAGQIGLDPATNKIVDGGITAQTKRVLENLKSILEAGGSSMDNVVKTTVFLKEAILFKGMNEVYANYFTKNKPARSTIVCDFMRPEVLVEIEAIAKI